MEINLLPENSGWKKKLQDGFDTERLVIRAFLEVDLKAVLAMSSDKGLFTYVADIDNCEELENWLKSVHQKRNYLLFTIKGGERSEYNGLLVGVVVLSREKVNRLEIGGWFGRKFHNKGYGSETASAFVKHVESNVPEMQLYAKISEGNSAVNRVLEVAGIEKK